MAERKKPLPVRKRLQRGRRRVYLVFTALLLLILSAAAIVLLHSAADRRMTAYVQKARESYEAGDCENALLYLRRVEAGHENAEVLLLMADCYEAMGNYPRALETLRKLNTSDPVVSGRIQAIEQKKLQETQRQIVTVGGVELDSASESATLDGLGLTDDDLKNLTALYALDRLSLRNNRLTDVAVLGGLKGLDELDLTGNGIRDPGPISELSSLRKLILDHNPIAACGALCSLRQLTSLSLVDTGAGEEDVRALAAALPDCAIRFGESGKERVLIAGGIYDTHAKEISLFEKGLTEISMLQNFTGLKILNLGGNEIADIRPLMELSGLESLNISDNLVSDLRPLIGLPLLTKLEAENNLIQETASVGSAERLTDLDLSGNPIRDFSGLGRLEALKMLDLTDTGITDADLPGLYGLKSIFSIDLRNNAGLSDKAVGALKSALPGCAILTSELVYEIDISGHLVRSDETKLLLPAAGITDLSGLAKMSRLEELDLRDNEIASLYPFEITASAAAIRKLNLANNRITDVQPLYALSGLEELDLSGNQIAAAVSLRKLTTLKKLNLSGNPVQEDAVRDLRDWMPDCEIIF